MLSQTARLGRDPEYSFPTQYDLRTSTLRIEFHRCHLRFGALQLSTNRSYAYPLPMTSKLRVSPTTFIHSCHNWSTGYDWLGTLELATAGETSHSKAPRTHWESTVLA